MSLGGALLVTAMPGDGASKLATCKKLPHALCRQKRVLPKPDQVRQARERARHGLERQVDERETALAFERRLQTMMGLPMAALRFDVASLNRFDATGDDVLPPGYCGITQR